MDELCGAAASNFSSFEAATQSYEAGLISTTTYVDDVQTLQPPQPPQHDPAFALALRVA
jgi:outer membrane protein TolC